MLDSPFPHLLFDLPLPTMHTQSFSPDESALADCPSSFLIPLILNLYVLLEQSKI